MATISENLQTIKSSMSAIKQAISDKGGDVSGDISTWANTISNIEGGVSSGGGAYSEVNHGTSDTTFTLTPNTFHVWDEVSSLTLTLGGETSGVANEYLFQFTSGATATTLMLPDTIKWVNDATPIIGKNMIYQVSILKGLASVLEFNNAPELIELIENKATLIDDTTGEVRFDYPVASDLTVILRGEMTEHLNFVVGQQSAVLNSSGGPSIMLEPYVIYSISIQSDNTYIYTF